MKHRAFQPWWAAALVLVGCAADPLLPGGAAGVLVEEVEPGLAADRAGLRADDTLIGWRGARAAGSFDTPFDLAWVEENEAPVADLVLEIGRLEERLEVELPEGAWGLRVGPALDASRLPVWRQARGDLTGDDPPAAATRIHQLADALYREGDSWTSAWLLYEAAHGLGVARRGEEAERLLAIAQQRLLELPDSGRARAWLHRRAGWLAAYRHDLPRATEAHEAALGLWGTAAPRSLAAALDLRLLAVVFMVAGEPNRAEELMARSLRWCEALAPASLAVADSLDGLGIVVRRQSTERALELQTRALDLRQRIAPESLETAASLHNLGTMQLERWRLAEAEEYLSRALAVRRRLAPDDSRTAFTLMSLGGIAARRGRWATAGDYQERACALLEIEQSESLALAACRLNLGDLAERQGDVAAAERSFHRALELAQRIAPHGPLRAKALQALGALARQHGVPDDAEGYYAEARAIHAVAAAGGLDHAATLHALGELAAARQDSARAIALLAEALAIREKLAPRSVLVAYSAHALGGLYRRLGDPRQAGDYFERAVRALEAQQAALGGSAVDQARFRDEQAVIFRDYVEHLLELGEESAAFSVLERSRRRRILDLIGPREHEIAQAWATPSPAAIQGRLAAGSLLLAYQVGEARSHLFMLPANGDLQVAPIDAGEAELAAAVERVRLLLERLPPAAARRGALFEATGALYELLLGPAAAELERAKRLVVVADGPLLLLPFGVLAPRQSAVPEAGRGYLVERLAISQSLTALSLPPAEPTAVGLEAPARLVAIGAPPGDQDGGRDAGRRLASGSSLGPLPAARQEILAVARIWGDSSAFVGERATEERIYELPRDTGMLHLAAHTILDEQLPMESGLVLHGRRGDPPGPRDGVLQAREILERLRLDADLVTLSACQSGLGARLRGEGLVGLTWAFHQAGARSVVASLWRIRDRSTVPLMQLFYRGLRTGLPKDEALRQAQLALIRGPVAYPAPATQGVAAWVAGIGDLLGWSRPGPERVDLSHPHHWAAFQLYGDPGRPRSSSTTNRWSSTGTGSPY